MNETSRVVLTGVGGFLGSHLAHELITRNVELLLIVHETQPSSVISEVAEVASSKDLQWRDQLMRFNPTHIIHAATRFQVRHSRDDIQPMLRSNIEFGTQLLDIAHACGSRFTTISSAWQMYQGKKNTPLNLYAATKQAFDTLADFYRAEGLNLSRLYLFDVYGPGDRRQKLVPLLMEAARVKSPLMATSGRQLIDLTYVDDVVRAVVEVSLGSDVPDCGDWVVKSGPISVRRVAEIMSEAIGEAVPVTWGAIEERNKEMTFDWGLEPVVPGWKPEVDLPDGLLQTWNEALRD